MSYDPKTDVLKGRGFSRAATSADYKGLFSP
jgi:hypothetical protein